MKKNKNKLGFFKVFFSVLSALIIIGLSVGLGLYFSGKVMPQGTFHRVDPITKKIDTDYNISVSGLKLSKSDQGVGRVEFSLKNQKLIYQLYKINDYKYDFKTFVVNCHFSGYLGKIDNDDMTVTFKPKKDGDKYVGVEVDKITKIKKEGMTEEQAKKAATEIAKFIPVLNFSYSNKNKEEVITLDTTADKGTWLAILGDTYKKVKK